MSCWLQSIWIRIMFQRNPGVRQEGQRVTDFISERNILKQTHTHRDWISVIYLKLRRLVIFKRRSGGQQVQEHLQEIHVLPCDIRNLENWAHSEEKHTHNSYRKLVWRSTDYRPGSCVRCALYLSELKLDAVTMTSSLFCTSTGIFLQPGDLSNLWSSLRVSATAAALVHQRCG